MIRLITAQKQAIVVARFQARTPVAQLARQVGMREHALRRAIASLIELRILHPFVMINIHALGITDYCTFLAHAAEKKHVRAKLLSYLQKSEQVAFAAELSGEFQYTASVFAKSIFDVEKFFLQMGKSIDGIRFDKIIAVRANWTMFYPKHLFDAGCSIEVEYLSRAEPKAYPDLDHTDFQVLSALAKMPLASYDDLSKELGLPKATVHYRVEQLENKKIIIGYPYWIESWRFGAYQFRFLIWEKSPKPDFHNRLFEFARKHPNIVGFVRCIGAWDFELNIEVFEPSNLNEILEEVYDTFSGEIAMIKSITDLRCLKNRQYPYSK